MMGREVGRRKMRYLKNFMLHGSEATGKYTTPKRSYILKSTSFFGLAVSAVDLDLYW